MKITDILAKRKRSLNPAAQLQAPAGPSPILNELIAHVHQGQATRVATAVARSEDKKLVVPTLTNEFWTRRQRAAHSLHEVSYRACFKPQLPRFFIERLTVAGDCVYDPFMGRGTTLIEAALLGRRPAGCDVNPLSGVLTAPRLEPPNLAAVEKRLSALDLTRCDDCPDDLLTFYHPMTLRELCSLRAYLLAGERSGSLDEVDRWIRMVAVNRLTGHSSGFFSVYTLPPNQAVSVARQRKINEKLRQTPPRRDVKTLIAAKTRSLLKDCDAVTRRHLGEQRPGAILITGRSDSTPQLSDGSVDLVVTSPPFLDVVDYAGDNWLRCWFCGFDANTVDITITTRVQQWRQAIAAVLRELHRVVRPGGHVAFEVGEVRNGTVKLEEWVIPAAAAAGFRPELVLINAQAFTKTANCWGVKNNEKGTNTNRIVLLERD